MKSRDPDRSFWFNMGSGIQAGLDACLPRNEHLADFARGPEALGLRMEVGG